MWPVGLRKIIQRARAWARRLWRPRQVSNPLSTSKQRQPNTRGHQEGGEGTAATVSSREANPPDESADEFPVGGELGVQAVETGPDNETPPSQSDQPVVDDNESAKADVTDGVSAASSNPSIPPEDTPEKPESASVQPNEGRSRDASRGDTEAGNLPRSDSTDMPSEPQKKAGPSRDVISGGVSNSPASETKGGRSKPEVPRKTGGRRKGTSTSSEPRPRRQPTFRPELICRKSGGRWKVILSGNEECKIKEVQHKGKSLVMENGECCLSSFTDRLSIVFENDERDEFPMFDGKPLIFKHRKHWVGDGRKINGITKGHFIVVAPNEWERTGHVPVGLEGCADASFSAHYFFRDNSGSREDIGGFRGHEIALISSGLELNGDRILDDSKDGDLFVGSVPNLKVPQDIVWVRVGAEEKNGWKGENFKPAERILAEVLGRRQGRFFVRVYDDELKLLDSCAFRYLRNLKEIHVNGKPYTEHTILAPSPTGHLPTEVRFIDADGASIHPTLPIEMAHAKVEGSYLVVDSHPDGDAISSVFKSDTGRVDIALHLPRIWWQMKQDASEPDAWRDTPLTMTRQEFREYVAMGATMRLRLPRRVKSVHVGFGDELNLECRPKKEETTDISLLAIPLAEFVDYSQIDQRLNEDALFNVECCETTLTLIRVSRDPIPMITSFTCEPETVIAGKQATLRWTTRDTEADGVVIDPDVGAVESSGSVEVTPSETTAYTLRLTVSGLDDLTKAVTVAVRPLPHPDDRAFACVRCANGGWKQGKGFSYGELEAVGLATTDAAHRPIPIDSRRRSTHRENIETIRRLIHA